MRHGNSSVRAAALRRYAGIGPGDLRDVLEESIYDSSREARDAAAHLLGSLFEESARERWRRVIDSGAPERIRVAVTALSYVSETEDIARLEPFLDDPVASIRAAALRGLVHAKARGCDEYYLRALCDPSGLVVRHALRMMAKEGQLLGLAEIQQSHARASNERVRRQLIRAARLMGKWEALIFLLSLLATVDASVALEEIHRWLQLSNRRFTALDSETRATITKRLAEVGQSTDARLAAQIEEVMRYC
jgi:HEAT repeat protein